MKKSIAIAVFAVAAMLPSLSAFAAEPVPMVDVSVSPEGDVRTRTMVPSGFADNVVKSYVGALNDEVQNGSAGKLDVIAVGRRATVVITDYYDPSDFMTKQQNEMDRQSMMLGGVSAMNPRAQEAWNREYNARPDRARVKGYVEFDGRRVSFDIPEAMAGSSFAASELAKSVGLEAYQVIRSL